MYIKGAKSQEYLNTVAKKHITNNITYVQLNFSQKHMVFFFFGFSFCSWFFLQCSVNYCPISKWFSSQKKSIKSNFRKSKNISNYLISFCSFCLSSPILEKDSFIEHLYIVLSCRIK